MATLPVSQSQHEQLQEGGVYEQVLVVAVELGEARKPVSPATCGIHGGSEKPIKELDVLGVRQRGGRIRCTELWDMEKERYR